MAFLQNYSVNTMNMLSHSTDNSSGIFSSLILNAIMINVEPNVWSHSMYSHILMTRISEQTSKFPHRPCQTAYCKRRVVWEVENITDKIQSHLWDLITAYKIQNTWNVTSLVTIISLDEDTQMQPNEYHLFLFSNSAIRLSQYKCSNSGKYGVIDDNYHLKINISDPK